MPAESKKNLCNFSLADRKLTGKAIRQSLKAKEQWEAFPVEEKAAVFLRAADLLSSDSYRYPTY
jgi:1-pyrroline-5-carboxylate dehydrogenase